MNWLDVILIIAMALLFISGMVWLTLSIKEDETGLGVVGFLVALIGVASIFFTNFMIIDKKSGSTVGEITSVDKNFFGTTAVFIKVNNNSEEEYCVENYRIADKANNLIGKKVKITYGKRIGIYSTGSCSEAPIETIDVIDNN